MKNPNAHNIEYTQNENNLYIHDSDILGDLGKDAHETFEPFFVDESGQTSLAMDYLHYDPQFSIDEPDTELTLAKEVSAISVFLDDSNGERVRPDLAESVSEIWLPGHELGVARTGLRSMIRRKRNGLSESAVRKFVDTDDNGVEALAGGVIGWRKFQEYLSAREQQTELSGQINAIAKDPVFSRVRGELMKHLDRDNTEYGDLPVGVARLDETALAHAALFENLKSKKIKGRARQKLDELTHDAESILEARTKPYSYVAFDAQSTKVIHVPYGYVLKSETEAARKQDPKERIVVSDQTKVPTEEARRMRAQKESLKDAAQAEQEAYLLKQQEADKLIDALIAEYSQLIEPMYNSVSNKMMRHDGILGKDSVAYQLRKQDVADERLQEHLRLISYAASHIDDEEFATELTQAKDIDGQLIDLCNGSLNQRRSKQPSLLRDLEWMTSHDEILRAIFEEKDKPELTRGLDLLQGTPAIDNSGQAVLTQPAIDMSPATPIDTKAERESIEQLDWVVLPHDELEIEDLIKDAVHTSKNPHSQRLIEESRLKMILDLRSIFDECELYRSSERQMGDPDNLYYVLKFTNPDDGKVYAIAENPMYGNATYTMREDLLPLMEGESVLTAVKLSRKHVRELGAKQLIHTEEGEPHIDKVLGAVSALSRR